MATTNKNNSISKHFRIRGWINRKIQKLRESLLGVFVASFATMFLAFHTLWQVFMSFNINLLAYIPRSDLSIYIFIVILLALTATILQMLSTNKLPQENKEQINSDSIVQLTRHSLVLGHDKDVILLGSALRQSACLKNKNNTKIQIGHCVLEAARNCNDIEAEATALIEDIGNTHLENGNAKEAIKHIEKGLSVIKEKIPVESNDCAADSVYYIAIRGYRNLANCYSYEKNKDAANEQLAIAKVLKDKIHDKALKLQVMGDLEYAESKISKITSNWQDTIKHLEDSIAYYDKLCEHDDSPENERKRMESTTKNYRELGEAYAMINEPYKARTALKQGSKYATKNLDYENLVSICLLKAMIASETEPDGEGVSLAIKDAEKHIQYVDSPKIIAKFEKTKKKLSKKTGAGKHTHD